jgi:methylglutaconyl-CoA hydratase
MTTTIEIERRGAASWLWMNRADVHNAFDERLIAELTQALKMLDADTGTRVIVLAGRGKSFSAGGDMNWMQRQGSASPQENLADARLLADLFETLGGASKPTIARVHGAAIGGGMGLAAACHICVATPAASFATPEVKLGIVPGVISPYVLRAIGVRQCMRYFQTAERIDAVRAHRMGLVHELVEPAQLDTVVQAIVDAVLQGGPKAQLASLHLIRTVADQPLTGEVIERTARWIAEMRGTPEAREGLTAFLEKRPASWAPAKV